MKLLMVDDEWSTLEFLEHTIDFNRYGITITGKAMSGENALLEIEKNRPDIIITDIKMPRMDGLELIKRIRSNDTNMKIIILSAYGEFEYAQNAIKYGVDGYILKPIDEHKLEEVFDKITGKLKETEHKAVINSYSKNTLVNNAKQYLECNYNSNISLEKMCQVLAVSKNYFCFLFKKETNQSIWDYLTHIRIEKAKELLKSSDMKVYEISDNVGFDDANYFTKLFKKITQVTPQQYRGKNE